MLMVVFGAGASYDSVPSRPPASGDIFPGSENRPPLADQLFDDRPRFIEAMKRFPRCQPIIPYLQNRKGVLIERALEELRGEAGEYPERHRQLAAVRYYLHFVLWECVRHWNDEVAKGITNYKTLLDQIERWRKPGEHVCLVTFNYDKMLEEALPTVGIEIQNIRDYVYAGDYKAVKLHGSVDWARVVTTPLHNIEKRNVWNIVQELINRAAELTFEDRHVMLDKQPIGKSDGQALFPALAIPVESKSEYECPLGHLKALEECLPRVTKLLLVGWRATETRFLELLRKTLPPGEVSVLVVAGNPGQASEPIERLETAGIRGRFFEGVGGFTELVVEREADEFLRS